MATDDDKTVKELIDAATRAELERWFSLPSFEQGAAQAPEPEVEDPEMVAVREQRARAIAAVDPALLEAHRRRTDPPDWLIRERPDVEIHVDPSVALLDLSMIGRQLAEPREVEISEELRDDLRDCTPQALLRDLHRPELDFDKTFEIVDMAAEQRLDIVAAVAEVMTTRYALTEFITSPFAEGEALLAEVRVDRMRPIPLETLVAFPNRWVTE